MLYYIYISSTAVSLALRCKSRQAPIGEFFPRVHSVFPRLHVDVRTNGSSFGTQFLNIREFCAFYFVRKLTYIDLWMSVNRTMSITSFPRVIIPPYRCDEMDARAMRRIEKQMCAHPHVRLGHGSKDTAHVRVDTSIIIFFHPIIPICLKVLHNLWHL